MSATFDVLIHRGPIHDAIGAAPYIADIGMKDGLVAAIDDMLPADAEEIDATGRIVTPFRRYPHLLQRSGDLEYGPSAVEPIAALRGVLIRPDRSNPLYALAAISSESAHAD